MAEADEHTVVPDFMMRFSSSSRGRFFCDCCLPSPAPLPLFEGINTKGQRAKGI